MTPKRRVTIEHMMTWKKRYEEERPYMWNHSDWSPYSVVKHINKKLQQVNRFLSMKKEKIAHKYLRQAYNYMDASAKKYHSPER